MPETAFRAACVSPTNTRALKSAQGSAPASRSFAARVNRGVASLPKQFFKKFPCLLRSSARAMDGLLAKGGRVSCLPHDPIAACATNCNGRRMLWLTAFRIGSHPLCSIQRLFLHLEQNNSFCEASNLPSDKLHRSKKHCGISHTHSRLLLYIRKKHNRWLQQLAFLGAGRNLQRAQFMNCTQHICFFVLSPTFICR